MGDGEALLKAILEAPDEDVPRLVYADWLQENGLGARADFIRRGVRKPRVANETRLNLELAFAFKLFRGYHRPEARVSFVLT